MDVDLIGRTLARVHSMLVGAPVPDGLDRWPWRSVDPTVIDEPDLRTAATKAIDAANRLAPTLTTYWPGLQRIARPKAVTSP